MTLTPEQLKFKAEQDLFMEECRQAFRESRELQLRANNQIKRFKRIESTIREMAQRHKVETP